MLASGATRLDTPDFLAAINDMITNNGKGNPELTNLPRKLNIGLSPSRDDFPHTHINDVGLKAVHDPETGEVLPSCIMTCHYASMPENAQCIPVTREKVL